MTSKLVFQSSNYYYNGTRRRRRLIPILFIYYYHYYLLVFHLFSLSPKVLTSAANDNDNNDNNNNNNNNDEGICLNSSIGNSYNKLLKRLTPNTLHKICAPNSGHISRTSVFGSGGGGLQQPICGDGTEFSFYVMRPPQKYSNDDGGKILVEFMGGGACWDDDTCQMQSSYLTFPSTYDDYVGLSCSEMQYGLNGNGNNGNNNNNQKFPMNMLCAQSLSSDDDDDSKKDVDLRQYTTIVVPYCTQDVHLGDASQNYNNNDNNNNNNNNNDNNNNNIIYHHGAHNTMTVLRYMYRNFKNPSHILLTGCSAGGTAIPVVYSLLNQHYNKKMSQQRSTSINSIMDSPVYLTPQYFLENGFGHWNTRTLIRRIGFNHDKYSQEEDYSTLVWDHVLKHGSNKDQWGFVSHTNDPVSEFYWEVMGGALENYDDAQNYDANDDVANTWWSDLSNSISTIQSNNDKSNNVHTFYIDGEGHCSFGLYYGFQQEGFTSWVATIWREQSVWGYRPLSTILFAFAFFMGFGSAAVLILAKGGRGIVSNYSSSIEFTGNSQSFLGEDEDEDEDDDDGEQETYCDDDHNNNNDNKNNADNNNNNNKGRMNRTARLKFLSIFPTMSQCPITTGYTIVLTIYFLSSMLFAPLAHPLDNPSLGPTAITLSTFGICNPYLVVVEFQIISRLFTLSHFLCSGLLTYLVALLVLYRVVRHVEMSMVDRYDRHSIAFLVLWISIAWGSTILYCLVGDGASCGCPSSLLGLCAYSICNGDDGNDNNDNNDSTCNEQVDVMVQDPSTNPSVHHRPKGLIGYIVLLVLVGLIFPFNSWILFLAAFVIGALLSPRLYTIAKEEKEEEIEGVGGESATTRGLMTPHRPMMAAMAILYLLSFSFLMLNRNRPNSIYQYAYNTGCSNMYTNDVERLSQGFQNNDNGEGGEDGRLRRRRRRRRMEGDEENEEDMGGGNVCAQFCVPHLIEKPFYWGVGKYTDYSLQYGLCEYNGYGDHIADKTFSYLAYDLDVELYYLSNQNAD